MTPSNRNIFRVTGPLCGEFTGHRWIPLTKASDAELWCFLIFAWINAWVNHREAGDSRRHHAHYDVTLMVSERMVINYIGSKVTNDLHPYKIYVNVSWNKWITLRVKTTSRLQQYTWFNMITTGGQVHSYKNTDPISKRIKIRVCCRCNLKEKKRVHGVERLFHIRSKAGLVLTNDHIHLFETNPIEINV